MKWTIAALLVVLASCSASAQTIRFGGFTDAVFAYGSRSGGASFDTGELDVFVTVRPSDNWSFLAEGFLQHVRPADDIDLPSKKHFEIDLERLYVAYNPSDRLRIEIGQIHTGIIRWNAREHRSRFLQTPIDVPSIANREEQNGAWPLHFSGVWAEGRLPGTLGVEYGAGIGAARGSRRDEIQPLLDLTSPPAELITFSVAPDALTGFEAGLAAYRGPIPAHDGTLREVDTTLFTSYVNGGIELRGEWASMRHRRLSDSASFATHGWYALASFRPRGALRTMRPYIVIDHLDAPDGESFLAEVHDQEVRAAGVRWDLAKQMVLKGEARSHLARDGLRNHEFRVQVAFAF